MTDREALIERMTEAFVQTLLPGDELAVQRRIANLTYKRAMSTALAVIEAEQSVFWKPPTLAELARLQGIDPANPPDYFALATELFPTEQDFEEFQRYLAEARRPAPPVSQSVAEARRQAIDAGHDARWKKPEHVCAWKCPVVDDIDALIEAVRAEERERAVGVIADLVRRLDDRAATPTQEAADA